MCSEIQFEIKAMKLISCICSSCISITLNGGCSVKPMEHGKCTTYAKVDVGRLVV